LGNIFGFSEENTTYVFANGTTFSQANNATLHSKIDFDGVNSGEDLFQAYEAPKPSNSSGAASATPTTSQATITSLEGYPTPVVSKSPKSPLVFYSTIFLAQKR